MTTETTPKSPLDGLLRCENCKSLMVLDNRDPSRQPVYTCNPNTHDRRTHCPTPELKAEDLDDLIISQVMNTVLTKKNLMNLVAQVDQRYAEEGGQLGMPKSEMDETILTRAEIREIHTNSQRFVRAQGGVQGARDILGMFITEIRANPGKVTVHYSIPLPSDSPLAGSQRQEIDLPTEILSS